MLSILGERELRLHSESHVLRCTVNDLCNQRLSTYVLSHLCMLICEQVSVLSDTQNIRHRAAGSLHSFTYKYSNTYIVHLWLTNPWRTNPWPTNSRLKNPWQAIQFRGAWHTYTCIYVRIYVYIRTCTYIHKLRNIEIPEKKKRV